MPLAGPWPKIWPRFQNAAAIVGYSPVHGGPVATVSLSLLPLKVLVSDSSPRSCVGAGRIAEKSAFSPFGGLKK